VSNFAFDRVRKIETFNQTRKHKDFNKCMISVEEELPLIIILNILEVML
jgi:hypothetical protein